MLLALVAGNAIPQHFRSHCQVLEPQAEGTHNLVRQQTNCILWILIGAKYMSDCAAIFAGETERKRIGLHGICGPVLKFFINRR